MWKRWGITHFRQVFQNGMLCSFEDLRVPFHLPNALFTTSRFDMLSTPRAHQLTLSPTPVFRYVQSVQDTKGFISNCFGMLLPSYLEGCHCNAKENWEQDVGLIDDELCDNVLESILHSSLNTAQRLSQLYIVWVSYKLHYVHHYGRGSYTSMALPQMTLLLGGSGQHY